MNAALSVMNGDGTDAAITLLFILTVGLIALVVPFTATLYAAWNTFLRKNMAQRTKAFLLTSPEKFQQQLGNGSSNTDSGGNTGSPSSAGQNKVAVLCSPLAPVAWVDSLEDPRLIEKESGSAGEKNLSMSSVMEAEMLSWWKTLFPPIK